MVFIVGALIANVLEKSKTDKMARRIFPVSFTLLRKIFKLIQEHWLAEINLKFRPKFNLLCILFVNKDVGRYG